MVHHNRGIRTSRKRNRICGFFFFCAVFVRAALANVLVADGVISYSGLAEAGKSAEWLLAQLNVNGRRELERVILAIYDDRNERVRAYYKND